MRTVRAVGNRRSEGTSLRNLGNAYDQLGEFGKAIGFYEQALVIAREVGNRRGEGTAFLDLAMAHEKLGDQAKATPLAQAALAIFEQIEDPNAAKVRQWLAERQGRGLAG